MYLVFIAFLLLLLLLSIYVYCAVEGGELGLNTTCLIDEIFFVVDGLKDGSM